jgi:hypothetical protein
MAEFGVFISFDPGSVVQPQGWTPPMHVSGSFAPVPSGGAFNAVNGGVPGGPDCPLPRFMWAFFDGGAGIHEILTLAP